MTLEKIENRQIGFILFIMRTTIVISFLPVLTSANALQDAWVAALITFVGTALLVVYIANLGRHFPGQTVIEYSQAIVGPWLGRMLSLFYIWAFLIMAAFDIRIYAEVLKTGFLTNTPLSFILGTMIFTAVAAAYAGIEVIGRTADLLFPVFVIMLLLSLALPLPVFEFRNLEPVLAEGLGPPLMASITPIAVGMQALMLTIVQAYATKPQDINRTGLTAIAGAALVLVLVAVLTVGVIGADAGARSSFPFFRAIRAVEISEFLQRIEAPLIFAWGFGLFIGVSTFLFCLSRGIAQWVNLADHRHIVLPLAVLWGAHAIHIAEDIFQVKQFFAPQVVGPLVFFLLALPHGTLWLVFLGKRALGIGMKGFSPRKDN